MQTVARGSKPPASDRAGPSSTAMPGSKPASGRAAIELDSSVYFLNWEDAFSKAFFIDAHAASIPDCICCHADSLAVRISCNFL